jgi:hypothetical protein
VVKRKLTTSFGVFAVLAGMAVAVPAATVSASTGVVRLIHSTGTTSYSPSAPAPDALVQPNELGPTPAGDTSGAGSSHIFGVNRSRSIEHTAPNVPLAPLAAGVGVSSAGPLSVLSSFDGLNHRQSRLANGGRQFSLEPPDQGLCVGNGFQMEIINDVLRVYHANGTPFAGAEDLNTFFGYSPAIIRATKTTPAVFGEFSTDPSCYYDKTTNTWFADMLGIDTFSTSGDFKGSNSLSLAVSNSGDPTGTWTVYNIPVQDDGTQGTPNHGCTGIAPYGQATTPLNPNACLGDYPHLGADGHGIYLTTNEYSFFGNDFHGAQVYAISKQALALHPASISVDQIDTHGVVGGNSGFTIWPATAPNDLNSSANGGTEYFLSSNAADEAHGNGVAVGPRQSNQLLVWSLTNTSSLSSATPSVNLSHSILTVGNYVVPARSEQKAGETPLIDCLNKKSCATNFLLGAPDPFAPEPEYPIDSNDTRMQQVVFADGMVWGALDTAVNSSANTRAGVEWFVVNPTTGTLANSGYLAVSQNNVIYPAIAVTPDGHGIMAFTLVGRDFYPSAAFASISAAGTGTVQVAAAGAGPADGFSGTAVFNAPNPARPRWGDYGAAVFDGSNFWIASEYIGQTCTLPQYLATGASCGGTRTVLANWGTRLTEVKPS